MLWPRDAEKVTKKEEDEKLYLNHLQEVGRKNYAVEMARARNLIAEAIDMRLHFVDIECEMVGYRSFVKIINTIANEHGSYILNRHFHSPPIDVSYGKSRTVSTFASLKLAVAPKNAE